MPHIPRTLRQAVVQRPSQQSNEPMELAPLATPNRELPKPSLPGIPELPMDLAPAASEQRPRVPKVEQPKSGKRPGVERISARKWTKSADEIANFLGLE